MSESPDRLEREIFEACLDLDPTERDAFLEHACEGDAPLDQRIRLLLAAHESSDPHGLSTPDDTAALDVPERIGPYRVLERVGEGGMGVVFLAEQTQPIRRRVALKIIKLGMDTKEVMARFESERQVLALMNHPNIAGILDAGATERGRPYFVMEFVRGMPIAEYCDRRRLPLVERLELMVQVLGAVQHAHQKGVIHRDLKPSNILITEANGVPVPKVIDFGVAKATNQRLSDLTVHTRLGAMIGTPDYMSPEQAETTALDVDIRSDVYALGVVLYELLCGNRPHDLANKPPLRVQQIIVEESPGPPSARINAQGGNADAIARARRTRAKALERRLRGDLDRVTLKALRKERRHRYQTALEFADDIRRFLNGEPVEARAPSVAYRARKFVTRHSAAVAGTATVGILVITLVIFYTLRLASERDRAAREAAAAQQVTEFLVQLFEASDPGEARGSSVTARELLDLGARRLTDELDEQPEVRATLLHTIGRVYLELGLMDLARPLAERAVALRRSTLGEEHPDVAESLNLLGEIAYAQRELDDAEAHLRQALAIRRAALGQRHPDVAESLNNVGAVLWANGDLETAETLYREALTLREELHGRRHPDVLESMNNLAVLLHTAGDGAAADALYREVLETRQAELGEDHPRTLNSMFNLGVLLLGMDDPGSATPLLRQALERRRRVLGNEHPETLESVWGLARALMSSEDYRGAEPLLREAAAYELRTRGEVSASTRAALERVEAGR